ncbi:hypothetical protein Asp14428_44740 [Actinoplanes sp. NBRC 14428]|nr:hypothetical protein Asp14428_44740 [Actinoplanes sp. NBRC 14428]
MDLSQDLSIDGSTSVSRTARNYRFTRVIPNRLPFLAEIGSVTDLAEDAILATIDAAVTLLRGDPAAGRLN